MTITDKELAEMRERVGAATEGPWAAGHTLHVDDDEDGPMEWVYNGDRYEKQEDDSAFCAHARTDMPRLLDEVDRLRAELKRADDTIHSEFCSAPGCEGGCEAIERAKGTTCKNCGHEFDNHLIIGGGCDATTIYGRCVCKGFHNP